jgi:hypothetical protein
MSKWIGVIGALAACFAVPAATQERANGQIVHIETDFNIFTHSPNHWVSTGAFEDQGYIDTANVNHGSTGAADHVTGPFASENGTIDIEFVKAYRQRLSYGVVTDQGTWHIVGGTGAYEGITGRGTLRGTINTITGALHDEFDGTVILPN